VSRSLSQSPGSPPALRRVSVRVPAAEAEIGRALLLKLVPAGFEEVDRGDEVELAVFTDEAGEERFRSTFAGVVSSEPVPLGWEERWRDFHRPARAGGLWIGPPWEVPPPGEPAVVVDPGRAFGTGAHPTTRACIELLSQVDRSSVLDAGTGSGVIAVAAARLGYEPVHAIDVDPAAVEAASATARLNGVDIGIWQGDALTAELPETGLVVANIELRAVEALLERRPAVRAVTSGYLVHDQPMVVGWERVSRVELEGWAADLLVASRHHLLS
jgi:ribosomal protein L11 methyltransferase